MAMEFKQFVFNSFQVNLTLVTLNRKSILFDAPCNSKKELQQIDDYLNSANSLLCAIVLTHAHIDHIVGCKQIQDKYNVPIYVHTDDLFLFNTAPQMAEMFGFKWESAPEVEHVLNTENELTIEGINFKCFHVPGHSPGSLVYYFETDKKLIAGDVLFNGSIGRTDLPGGD